MKIFFAVLAIFVLVIAGCDDSTPDNGDDVSFESFSSPSIYVDNNSNERLIAFKGYLNPNNLISGIPANVANHGLQKNPSLFTTTGDFVLILITEAEYNKNKVNPASATVFTEIYAFYNHEAANNNRVQISSKLGGIGRIILTNTTNWNIEIRQDSPSGEVLGYVAPQTVNKELRVAAPGEYSLYPVFKRYTPSEKELYTVVPTYTSGNNQGEPYMMAFTLSTTDAAIAWDLSEVANAYNFNTSFGSFYLTIQNNYEPQRNIELTIRSLK